MTIPELVLQNLDVSRAETSQFGQRFDEQRNGWIYNLEFFVPRVTGDVETGHRESSPLAAQAKEVAPASSS